MKAMLFASQILRLIILTSFLTLPCFGTTVSDETESKIIRYRFLCCPIWTFINSSQKNRERIGSEPENFLASLPNELIQEITGFLDPLSTLKLSHVSKRFAEFLNNDFWVKYNADHKHQNFNEDRSYFFVWSVTKPAPAVKVMIANYCYEIGITTNKRTLIQKASFLGLRKAQIYLEKEWNSVILGANSYNPRGAYRACLHPTSSMLLKDPP